MSKPSVFLTGATGFLGSRVLRALIQHGYPVVALDRSGSLPSRLAAEDLPFVEPLHADLLEPEKYTSALRRTQVVVHLAAATGRAAADEHVRVNVRGVEALVDASRRAGVGRLLFVSSIATKFPDKRHYHYALAKTRSEETVRRSGLRFVILRPTIVLGPGSAVLAALERLALLPVIPIFGTGRALVQPIHVDDLADGIVAVLEHDRFRGETLDIGGPKTMRIEELILEIRRTHRGAGEHARSVHIPVRLLLPLLVAAERLGLARLMPVTAGQLSSFRFDGIAEGNPLFEGRRAALCDLKDMLAVPSR